MKDGSKTISERATRFLPVDMKDRLKSAFHRNSPNPISDDEVVAQPPDFVGTFEPNRPTAPKAPRLSVQTTPGGSKKSGLGEAGFGNLALQLGNDIEEAEIVLETMPAPEKASSVAAEELICRATLSRAVEADSRKDDSKAQVGIAAKLDNSKHEEAVSQKSKSRFFGDFTSNESVRLKIEKRNEKRPLEAPLPPGNNSQLQAAPIEPGLPEEKSLATESAVGPGLAPDAPGLEQPSAADRGTIAPVAAAPAIAEQTYINLPEENYVMDAKGTESENGAPVRTDGNAGKAAFSIERNSKFSGQLKFAGVVAIDGQVEGAVVADHIVVNEGGIVNASVEAATLVIAGTVTGDVLAHDELEILATGVVDGSVTAPAISVRRGGRVEGRCTIGVERA